MIPNKPAKLFVNQKYKRIGTQPLHVNFTSVNGFFFVCFVLSVFQASIIRAFNPHTDKNYTMLRLLLFHVRFVERCNLNISFVVVYFVYVCICANARHHLPSLRPPFPFTENLYYRLNVRQVHGKHHTHGN